jgi:hypothetical protein
MHSKHWEEGILDPMKLFEDKKAYETLQRALIVASDSTELTV